MPSPKPLNRPRKMPTQERARRTQETILEAAAHIVAQHGYEGANTNLIAAKAGVSIGSLYQYFPNKESIIGSLVEKIYLDDRAMIEKRLVDSENEDFASLCKSIIDSLIETYTKRTELRKVIYYEIPRSGRLTQINSIRNYLAEILDQYLQQRKDFKDRPNRKLRMFILVNAVEATLYAAVFEYGRKLDRQNFSMELTDMVVRFCSNN